jgi:hypothetical protein
MELRSNTLRVAAKRPPPNRTCFRPYEIEWPATLSDELAKDVIEGRLQVIASCADAPPPRRKPPLPACMDNARNFLPVCQMHELLSGFQ